MLGLLQYFSLNRKGRFCVTFKIYALNHLVGFAPSNLCNGPACWFARAG